jgi:ATP dependent DNA ligase-like protein
MRRKSSKKESAECEAFTAVPKGARSALHFPPPQDGGDPEWAGFAPCSTLPARPSNSNGMSAFSGRRRVQAAIPFQPCLPRRADTPPTGPGWIHEIKHDGFRIVARRVGGRVRLFTRNGYDFTARFPRIASAVAALPVRSCVVDGEAIVVDRMGLDEVEGAEYGGMVMVSVATNV